MISIILPTLNESENIDDNVATFKNIFKDTNYELIFVDDNSTDGTRDIIKKHQRVDNNIKLLTRLNRTGLSSAIFDGVSVAEYDYVCVVDADLQYNLEPLNVAVDEINDDPNIDIIIFNRTMINNKSATNLSDIRYFITNIASWITKKTLKYDIQDPNTGFFLMKKEIIENNHSKLCLIGYKFLLDVLLSVKGLVVHEVQTDFNERRKGTSKLNVSIFIDFFEMYLDKFTGFLIPGYFVMYVLCGLIGLFFVLLFNILITLFSYNDIWILSFSSLLAIPINFYFNNIITFRHYKIAAERIYSSLFLYFLICSIGVIFQANILNDTVDLNSYDYVLSLLLSGSWNFLMAKNIVWRVR